MNQKKRVSLFNFGYIFIDLSNYTSVTSICLISDFFLFLPDFYFLPFLLSHIPTRSIDGKWKVHTFLLHSLYLLCWLYSLFYHCPHIGSPKPSLFFRAYKVSWNWKEIGRRGLPGRVGGWLFASIWSFSFLEENVNEVKWS